MNKSLKKIDLKIGDKIDWEKLGGLIPAIIQDSNGGDVLMIGYMNSESLAKTLKTKRVWFYSRSKKRLWMKGEVSNNTLTVADISLDCDKDALLILCKPNGPTCHTNAKSCFSINSESLAQINSQKNLLATKMVESSDSNPLRELFSIITDRKNKLPPKSYTAALLKGGLPKICAKVCEESLEVIQAALQESKQRVIEESVDVLYHLFVLLNSSDVCYEEVMNEVRSRRGY